MTTYFLIWVALGAATHLLTIEEDTGPWWMTVAVVLSWPIFLLAHYTNVHIEVGIFEIIEDGEDE